MCVGEEETGFIGPLPPTETVPMGGNTTNQLPQRRYVLVSGELYLRVHGGEGVNPFPFYEDLNPLKISTRIRNRLVENNIVTLNHLK
jgi:hypothetical protein